MTVYNFKIGDGNEGCYGRDYIRLGKDDCPFAAIVALAANRYIVGTSRRRFIRNRIETDGDADYTVYGTVYNGPKGESAMGAAWQCYELVKAKEEDAEYEGSEIHNLKDYLDKGAYQVYRNEMK